MAWEEFGKRDDEMKKDPWRLDDDKDPWTPKKPSAWQKFMTGYHDIFGYGINGRIGIPLAIFIGIASIAGAFMIKEPLVKVKVNVKQVETDAPSSLLSGCVGTGMVTVDGGQLKPIYDCSGKHNE